jgi:hypothetical protein
MGDNGPKVSRLSRRQNVILLYSPLDRHPILTKDIWLFRLRLALAGPKELDQLFALINSASLLLAISGHLSHAEYLLEIPVKMVDEGLVTHGRELDAVLNILRIQFRKLNSADLQSFTEKMLLHYTGVEESCIDHIHRQVGKEDRRRVLQIILSEGLLARSRTIEDIVVQNFGPVHDLLGDAVVCSEFMWRKSINGKRTDAFVFTGYVEKLLEGELQGFIPDCSLITILAFLSLLQERKLIHSGYWRGVFKLLQFGDIRPDVRAWIETLASQICREDCYLSSKLATGRPYLETIDSKEAAVLTSEILEEVERLTGSNRFTRKSKSLVER